MNRKRRSIICLVCNVILLLIVMIPVVLFAGESSYYRFGPQEDLYVISIPITTSTSYILVCCVLMVVSATKIVIEDIGTPLLAFSIYNPDQKVIEGFTSFELQFFANAMFSTTNLRILILMVVSITQFDLALISLFSESVATFFVIRYLTQDKTFSPSPPPTFDSELKASIVQTVNEYLLEKGITNISIE